MSAKTLADLPASVTVTVKIGKLRVSDPIPSQFLFLPVQFEIGTKANPWEVSVATIVRWHDFQVPCPWVMENIEAGVHSGWGPFTYDIAMEFATMHGRGLVACGQSTNEFAARIWNYYLTRRREEVEIEELPKEFLAKRRSKAVRYIYRKAPPTTIYALGDHFIVLEDEFDLS